MLARAWGTYDAQVLLRDSIDEIDVLIAELSDLRKALSRAELSGAPEDALWDAEAALRHVARRSEARAKLLRRAIELSQSRSA